jgi:hypothetical protein
VAFFFHFPPAKKETEKPKKKGQNFKTVALLFLFPLFCLGVAYSIL